MKVAIVIAIVATILTVFFGCKYFATYISVLAYIYWGEEHKYIQPTKEQLDVYRRKVIQEMFK